MIRHSVGLAVMLCLTACRQTARVAISARLEPLTFTVTARAGGTVEEVFAQAGDRVEAGARLVRLRPAALAQRDELNRLLAAARAAVSPGALLASLPPALRNMLVDAHPDVERAENEYADAVRNRAAPEQLQRAAAERVATRHRVSRMVGAGGGASVVAFLEARRRELDALGDGLIRSEQRGLVDMLDLRPGDRVWPGGAVALIVTGAAYSAEFELPPGVTPPAAGAQGTARVNGREVPWTVDSVQRRLISPGLREDRSITHRIAVRARIATADPIAPGTRAEFQWAGM